MLTIEQLKAQKPKNKHEADLRFFYLCGLYNSEVKNKESLNERFRKEKELHEDLANNFKRLINEKVEKAKKEFIASFATPPVDSDTTRTFDPTEVNIVRETARVNALPNQAA